MKKSIITLAALLCVSALAGCNQGGSSSSVNTSGSVSSLPSTSETSTSSKQDEVKVESVTVTPGKSTVTLTEGNTIQLTAIVMPENATEKGVVWSVSDKTLATVSETGLVTCLAQGTVRVTATSKANNTIKDMATVVIRKYESQDDVLDALNVPQFYETYKKNTQSLDDVEDINGASELLRTTYFKNEQGKKDIYRVGSDNGFKLNITGKITDENGTDSVIADPHTVIEVEKYNTSTKAYVKLEGNDFSSTLTVSEDHNTLQFKDAAVNNQYRITVKADSTAYKSLGAGYSPIVLEVEVVKAFNAYNNVDLSVLDNRQSEWNAIKEAAGLKDVTSNGLVLHSDITINEADVPQGLKYSQQEIETYINNFHTDFSNWCVKKEISEAEGKALLIGSTKDCYAIYERQTNQDSKDFLLEGNYFKINCSGIKQVYAFSDSIAEGTVSTEYSPDDPSKGCDGSHSQLFGFNDYSVNKEIFAGGGNVDIKNVTVIGNGDLSSDDKYMGGLITFKYGLVNFNASNILTSKSFTTFICELNTEGIENVKTKTVIDRCKAYDSYNSMLYIWGVEDNTITNSVMKRAGGAIALLDEVNAADRDAKNHGTPKVKCYNVDLDNPVTGLEPWFNAHKATSLVQMLELFGDASTGRWLGRNALTHGEHKNILTLGAPGADGKPTPYLNLIAIDIDGRDPLTNSLDKGSMLQGNFTIYKDKEFTQIDGCVDMSRIGAVHPADPNFAQLVGQEALMKGNYLPTYRAAALQQGAQGIIVANEYGHAMLSDAPSVDGEGNMDLSTGFKNGVVLQYDASYNVVPAPFYADNTGAGAEYAANAGEGYKRCIDGLATGNYLSIYLQPSAGYEYLGAFVKMQYLDASLFQ